MARYDDPHLTPAEISALFRDGILSIDTAVAAFYDALTRAVDAERGQPIKSGHGPAPQPQVGARPRPSPFPPVPGVWYWVSFTVDAEEQTIPALCDPTRAGGWTNSDTWEDFDGDVTSWWPIPPLNSLMCSQIILQGSPLNIDCVCGAPLMRGDVGGFVLEAAMTLTCGKCGREKRCP